MSRLIRSTAKAVIAAGLVAGALLALVGCDTNTPPAPPTTVVVNTPPADGGLAVLLTVVIGLAVLFLIGAAVAVCAWSHERRTRREAQGAVYALTRHHPTRTAATGAPVTAAPDVARLLALEPDRTPIERQHR